MQCPVYVAKVDDVGERGAHLVAYNLLLTLKGGAAAAPAPVPSTAHAAETTPVAAAPPTSAPVAAPVPNTAAAAQTPSVAAPPPAVSPATNKTPAPTAAAAKKDKKKKDCVVQ